MHAVHRILRQILENTDIQLALLHLEIAYYFEKPQNFDTMHR